MPWKEWYAISCLIFNGFILLNNLEDRRLLLAMTEEILSMIPHAVNNYRCYRK